MLRFLFRYLGKKVTLFYLQPLIPSVLFARLFTPPRAARAVLFPRGALARDGRRDLRRLADDPATPRLPAQGGA